MEKSKKYITADQLPEGEKVYLRKGYLGWFIVHPIRDENGKLVLVNLLFGGWRNLLFLLFVLILILGHLHEDRLNLESATENCELIYQNPNGFCKAVCENDNIKLQTDYNYSFFRDVIVNVSGD